MLKVEPIRAFADNYIWVIRGSADPTRVAIVDPGDAAPVVSGLEERGLHLTCILITHHHPDHVGGIPDLLSRFSVPVYGPARETIPGITHKLGEGDRVTLAEMGLEFRILDVPGHTAGHIAYVGHGAVFCGDTLFSAGCGRLFEGTPEQMANSLDKLAKLDPQTRVYCTHEYTLSNLRFAQAVEPGNSALAAYSAECQAKRACDESTIPSTIALEHSVNPFLRCATQSVKQAAEAHVGHALDSSVAIFAAVRAWKDGFKPTPP